MDLETGFPVKNVFFWSNPWFFKKNDEKMLKKTALYEKFRFFIKVHPTTPLTFFRPLEGENYKAHNTPT